MKYIHIYNVCNDSLFIGVWLECSEYLKIASHSTTKSLGVTKKKHHMPKRVHRYKNKRTLNMISNEEDGKKEVLQLKFLEVSFESISKMIVLCRKRTKKRWRYNSRIHSNIHLSPTVTPITNDNNYDNANNNVCVCLVFLLFNFSVGQFGCIIISLA